MEKEMVILGHLRQYLSSNCFHFLRIINLLLVAKGALQDNILLAGGVDDLKGAVLKEVLDGGGDGLVGGNVLLVANLGGELVGELSVDLGGGSAEDGGRESLDGELGLEDVAGSTNGGAAESDGRSRDGAESTGGGGARDSTKRHHLDGFGGVVDGVYLVVSLRCGKEELLSRTKAEK